MFGSGHGNETKPMRVVRRNKGWTGDTIDQQIASVIGNNTPFRSFTLGCEVLSSRLGTRRSGSKMPTQNSPEDAYTQLFGGVLPAGGGDNINARKQSALDINREALTSLRNKLGQFERESLEKHIDALGELEKRLDLGDKVEMDEACKSPVLNAKANNEKGFAPTANLHSDIITNAFACGLTNVMTLQLGSHSTRFKGHNTKTRRPMHNACHAAPVGESMELANYLSGINAYLIRQLMERDDPAVPGTKLIDNTVVLQVTNMGNGRNHKGKDGPNVLTTRMPGFKQGTQTRGGNNYHVLESVIEGMGLSQFKGKDTNRHKICASRGHHGLRFIIVK